MIPEAITRRKLLQGGLAVGAATLLPMTPGHAAVTTTESFAGDGERWPDRWQIDGVANLRLDAGTGVLEAATDIYPADARAIAFLVDHRFRDGVVVATIAATGTAGGVVLRRTGPRQAYLATYSMETGLLQVIAKTPTAEQVLATATVPSPGSPVVLRLAASGRAPTTLQAGIETATGPPATINATDATDVLQTAGDPGVIATADTGFPTGPDVPPIIGSARAVTVTDAGDDVEDSPVGGLREEVYRQVSTAVFEEVTVTAQTAVTPTVPSVVAATTGAAHPHARADVVSDVPATIDIEVAPSRDFSDATVVASGTTNAFRTLQAPLETGLAGELYWRPVLRRGGTRRIGPVRRHRVLPPAGASDPVTVAVGGCGTEFKAIDGTVLDLLPDLDADVFAWIGDLNYPDSHGSLAQTVSGYAGIWKQFLAAPPLTRTFQRTAFAPQRDDHDYGRNDLAAGEIPAHGLVPWDHIMAPSPYYAFGGGHLDAWVLDNRQFKDPAEDEDTPDKSLLGREQRAWLLDGLAQSDAAFKVVLSPNPIWYATNNETCWARSYTAERELVLDHIHAHVSGTVLFVTADSHAAAVIERDGLLELRPCPIDLPAQPGWHDAATGDGVLFAEQGESYLAVLSAAASGSTATLQASLLRGDGSTAWSRTVEQPLAPDGTPAAADTDTDEAGTGGTLAATGGGTTAAGAALLGGAALLAASGEETDPPTR